MAVTYYYKGWRILDNGRGHHPVTERFQAFKFGVRIGNTTLAGLLAMIDARDA